MTESDNSHNPSREREEIMTKLATRIDSIDDRVATQMRADETDDRLLIRWIRAQGYLAGQYRKLMKDTDIDEIQDDLELLKDVTEINDQ